MQRFLVIMAVKVVAIFGINYAVRKAVEKHVQ